MHHYDALLWQAVQLSNSAYRRLCTRLRSERVAQADVQRWLESARRLSCDQSRCDGSISPCGSSSIYVHCAARQISNKCSRRIALNTQPIALHCRRRSLGVTAMHAVTSLPTDISRTMKRLPCFRRLNKFKFSEMTLNGNGMFLRKSSRASLGMRESRTGSMSASATDRSSLPPVSGATGRLGSTFEQTM